MGSSQSHPLEYATAGWVTSTPFTNSVLVALDYGTGTVRWRHEGGLGLIFSGILTTAEHLLFTGDTQGNLLALDLSNSKALWHTLPGANISHLPMTCELGGTQYVVTAANTVLYAWTLKGSLD